MKKETKKYNEDYLNGLIKKAKKSWEGVDVDSFIEELPEEDTWGYMHRKDGVYVCCNREMQ